jgi:predicted protein tyrosine phosphatase
MIAVRGLVDALRQHHEFDSVLTIKDADGLVGPLWVNERRPHLVLEFNDIDFDDGSPLVATRWQVRQAVEFGRLAQQESRSLLIHCNAGRCRSPAIALAILADLLGPGREEQAVDEMLITAPKAAPNLLVLKHADGILGLRGKLQAAWMDRYENNEEIVRLRRLKRELLARKQREARCT